MVWIRVCIRLVFIGLAGASALAEEVQVRYAEGTARGFMVLRDTGGAPIANGDEEQTMRDGVVTSRLTFRFKDGSVYEETTTFTQRGTFRLLTNHLIQKGPTFPRQLESWIDTSKGRVKAHSSKDGKVDDAEETFEFPPDLANGMLFTIVKNAPAEHQMSVSYLAFTPKPRIIKMVFTREGTETLQAAQSSHAAARFLMKADIGGIAGAVAAVTGKKPADTRMWVITGIAPTFAGSEGPLYSEGPVWRIDLVSPGRKPSRE